MVGDFSFFFFFFSSSPSSYSDVTSLCNSPVFPCRHHSRAAIVTCGGLCPGLNNVIRGVYHTLTRTYGVKPEHVYGVRYGYRGFYEGEAEPSAGDVSKLALSDKLLE